MRRKRIRRHRPRKQNSRVKFIWFVAIILGTVICGYLTARFFVGPLLGYDTEVLKLDFPSKMALATKEDKDSSEGAKTSASNKESESGYLLQFGVFSTREGAETLSDELKSRGIDTSVKKDKQQYKVISETFSSKEKALERLESLKEQKNLDVFITKE